jgi:hypothetical protein
MSEIVNSVRQVEWNEALSTFQEACYMFYEDTRGRLKEFPQAELKKRADRYDEARQELYGLIERQCEKGEGVEIVLDEEEGETVEIAEPNWYTNGSIFSGYDSDNLHNSADLMKAERIQNL